MIQALNHAKHGVDILSGTRVRSSVPGVLNTKRTRFIVCAYCDYTPKHYQVTIFLLLFFNCR